MHIFAYPFGAGNRTKTMKNITIITILVILSTNLIAKDSNKSFKIGIIGGVNINRYQHSVSYTNGLNAAVLLNVGKLYISTGITTKNLLLTGKYDINGTNTGSNYVLKNTAYSLSVNYSAKLIDKLHLIGGLHIEHSKQMGIDYGINGGLLLLPNKHIAIRQSNELSLKPYSGNLCSKLEVGWLF